ncbi:hypothetical protein ACQPYK_12765 [Streptosporangium sp. CA-135522]|uniref:hypothetical protein n=1 Tax=Streptosporangium sp. CA-135522 TaxID=3240072 RepID=UPI003D937600
MTACDKDHNSTRDAADQQPSPDIDFHALSQAFHEATRAIRAMPEPRDAYDTATRLANEVRNKADLAAQVRAEAAARIHEAEKLSIAGLAECLGISKARAAQLLKAARKAMDGNATK